MAVFATLFAVSAQAGISSSASYRITAEILDSGGLSGSSVSYRLLGKARDHKIGIPLSASFIIGEGFLKSAYFARIIFAPIVTGIDPSNAENTQSVSVAVSGANFTSGAVIKLSKVGEIDILAENVAVESAGKITGRFNLTGKAVGFWDVVVTNEDGLSGTLPSAFKIESPNLEIVKPVESEKNPFNPSTGPTALKYSLSKDADITIYIFNIRGERIWEYRAAAGSQGGKIGENEVPWDGITTFRDYASSGVYIVRVTAMVDGGLKTLSKTKIALIK